MCIECHKFQELDLPDEIIAKLVAWDEEMRSRERVIAERLTTSPPSGEAYEALVPDTLDLAACGGLVVNGLTRMLLPPELGSGLYQVAIFGVNPPCLSGQVKDRDFLGDYLDVPKLTEALPEMRVMSGSREGLEQERSLMLRLLATSWEDGVITGPPVHEYRRHDGLIPRFLMGCLYWYQYDGNSLWLEHARKILHTIVKILWDIFPAHRENKTAYGQPDNKQVFGWYILGLTRYSVITGDKEALEISGKLVEMLRRPECWDPLNDPDGVVGAEVGHSVQNCETHQYLFALRGLIEYSHAVNDAELKRFVRSSYDYWRSFGIPEIGFIVGRPAAYSFTETCAIADMLLVAMKLSDYGVGDYWEDVDQYVRNQLVENLITDREQLAACAAASFPHQARVPYQDSNNAIERSLGSFADIPFVTDYPGPWVGPCCNHNGAQALYQTWESIVRDRGDGVAQVNLLLNRASAQVDIDSYLPYEGKVVLKNKTATRLHVRIPTWVSKPEVRCSLGSTLLKNRWLGNYLLIEGVKPSDTVTIEFPVVERTFTRTDGATGWTYNIRVRGNTVMDIGPRPELHPAHVQNGRLVVHAPARIVLQNREEQDVRVSVTAQSVEDAGIILRYASSGDYVLAHYSMGSYWRGENTPTLAIYENVNGTFHLRQKQAVGKLDLADAELETIVDQAVKEVQVDTKRADIHLTAEVRGDVASLTLLAGKQSFTIEGKLEHNLEAGAVGLYALVAVEGGSDCHAHRPFQSFDDFRVENDPGQILFEDGFDGEAEGWQSRWEVAPLPTNYRFYLRDHLKGDKAPLVRKQRFVPVGIIRP